MKYLNYKQTNEYLVKIFYRALNSITNPTIGNAEGGAFMNLTFAEASEMW